ncbi:TetR/AcrR family transcriptional regulator [Actinocorallia sp. A-T 12471]|uniref:TetR/AcrR family transcriptional regulator n=1 Tax=Actinocorallia sp. A-T 12471 TaxID=3089813 RepID=UPI0029CEDAA5|nr:TetR/AcrR family transcriptional regulator [Actinocorallia sp. A-T 12471]MDX6740835.1 TetR/AcrR family transcriptional regulator [Actinocorallia sp. A-T 12471]
MRTHGWGGEPPASDGEAAARIKEATHRCVGELGGATTIAHVAAELGISRQTVYRYFPSTEALLFAAALDGTRQFLARLARRLRKVTDPGEALVEAVAYTIAQIPAEPYLRLLLDPQAGSRSMLRGVTSDTGRAIGNTLLDHTAVDWTGRGIGPERRAELVEWTLRVVQSFLLDPGEPARSGPELRAFLRRWLAPAVAAATDERQAAS